YPARKLAELWGKMALIQFHDCVTGTLSDGAYEELKKYVRQVRRGGEQIYRDAALELLRHTAPEVPAGFEAAVFFNPTRHAMRQATLCFNAPEDTASVQVFDRALRQLDVVGCDVKTAKVGTSLKATVLADVPPFSARVFFWKPSTAAQTVKSVTTAGDGDAAVENDFFRVKTDGRRIIEVFGKAQNRALLRDAALTLSEDIGSPWGREVPEKVIGRFEASSVTVERGEARQRITLKGQYRDAQVRTLDWRVSYTLNRGEDLIRVSTDIDWNGDQRHVYASFAPAFPFEEDLYCEVPFGMLKRPVIRDVNVLGICDEWPSLGYAGVEGDGVSFALLKGGHAGTSVKDGLIRLSLLRAPGYREPGFVKSYEGANDKGRHQAEFALAFAPCRFEDASFSEKAGAFAAAGHCECITGESAGYLGVTGEDDTVPLDAPLLPQLASLPSGVRISALKLAEDGKRTILRVWEGEGRPVLYALPEGIAMRRCTTLEEPADEFWTNTLSLRPFEIATFEIQFD
ncbi:MAG: hypothetical protein IJ048_00510, partial [Clostridia bacterium]|nr:hypothetical protein [Clostridia bacterium]